MTDHFPPSQYPHRFRKPDSWELFFDAGPHSFSFVALEICGAEESPDGSETPVYRSHDNEYPTDADLGTPLLCGDLKWDGCINVIFQPGYVHFCGARQAARVGEILAKIYDLGATHIHSFDPELAE